VCRKTTQNLGEMPELAEGARLEIVCAGRLVPRVRIPLSPPIFLRGKNIGEIFPKAEGLWEIRLFYLRQKTWRDLALRRMRRGGSAGIPRGAGSRVAHSYELLADATRG
jgi:hypothetical protein